MAKKSKVVGDNFFHAFANMQTLFRFKLMQVPLGIQFHDETKLDGMCHILEELQEYVPNQPITKTVPSFRGKSLLKGH